MKRFFLFASALVCALSLSAKKIYLDPGVWNSDKPAYFAHAWKGESLEDVLMTLEEGSNVYSATLKDEHTDIIFLRAKSGATSVIWTGDDKNVWNQTVDMKIPEDKDLFKVTAWHQDNDDNKPSVGEWSVYVAPEKKDIIYKVKVPAGTAECYIAGAWEGGENWTFQKMEEDGENQFKFEKKDWYASFEYKYCAEADWAREELDADGKKIKNRTFGDSVDVVAQFTAPVVYQTLKLVPGVWAEAKPVFGAWTWSKGVEGAWAKFTGEGDTLQAKINEKMDSIIFVRMNPEKEFGWDAEWNRIGADTIDHVGLTYTIIDWKKGQWEVYDPTQLPHFYITGDSALVVDAGLAADQAWNPAAIAVKGEDSYKLNLKANQEYLLKVTINGTWEGEVKGFDALATKPEGVVSDASDNIIFSLVEAGEVVVSLVDGAFNISGNFYVAPPMPDTWYIKLPSPGGAWAWSEMTEEADGTWTKKSLWVGGGADLNTKPDEEGKQYIADEEMDFGANGGAPTEAETECTFIWNPSTKKLAVDYKKTEGIESVCYELDLNAPMFDLLGRQVTEGYNGIVIQNGNKYIR